MPEAVQAGEGEPLCCGPVDDASLVVMEPWVGGSLRIDIEESGTEFYVIGSYTHLQRPSRLSFTWNCSTWPPATRDSVVTVTFERIGADQTAMTIEHTLLRPDFVDEHTRGWATIADQLDTRLRTRAALRP